MIKLYKPRFCFFLSFFFFAISSLKSQNPGITDRPDVQVFPSTNYQSENHISINNQNPLVLVASCNTYVSGHYSVGRYVSTNGGNTWSGADEITPGVHLSGDPVTGIDASGNIYIVSMNDPASGYVYTKSTNNGTTFGPLTSGGVNVGSNGFDKEWIALDNMPTSPHLNNFYAVYNAGSTMAFNSSFDGGVTFTTSKTLKSGNGRGPEVQTGPNGEVYVCWGSVDGGYPANGFGFMRSLDAGNTFTTPAVAVSYTGIETSGGSGVNNTFNKIGVYDMPTIAVDKSGKTFHGRIYVAFPCKLNGNGSAVIEMSHSDNQGTTWSTPVLVSRSAAYQCWEPAITVDQATGNVFVAYRNLGSAGNIGNTWVAISSDGGNTFINQLVSDVSYAVQPINNTIFRTGYYGDYIAVAAYGGKSYISWSDNRNGNWQTYVSEVDVAPAITGPTGFCSTGQFSVVNLPPDLHVNSWSASPAGVVTINSTGLATKLTQGNATITATLSNGQTTTFNITTTPQTVVTTSLSGGCTNGIQTWYLSATPNMSASSWNWTVDSPTSGITLFSPYSSSTYADVSRGGGVSVVFTNGCGETSNRNGSTIYSSCGHSFALSPNPATNSVTISPQLNNKTVASSLITEVNFYDQSGNLRKRQTFSKVNSAYVNVTNLTKGVYVVEIVTSEGYRERQLLNITNK